MKQGRRIETLAELMELADKHRDVVCPGRAGCDIPMAAVFVADLQSCHVARMMEDGLYVCGEDEEPKPEVRLPWPLRLGKVYGDETFEVRVTYSHVSNLAQIGGKRYVSTVWAIEVRELVTEQEGGEK